MKNMKNKTVIISSILVLILLLSGCVQNTDNLYPESSKLNAKNEPSPETAISKIQQISQEGKCEEEAQLNYNECKQEGAMSWICQKIYDTALQECLKPKEEIEYTPPNDVEKQSEEDYSVQSIKLYCVNDYYEPNCYGMGCVDQTDMCLYEQGEKYKDIRICDEIDDPNWQSDCFGVLGKCDERISVLTNWGEQESNKDYYKNRCYMKASDYYNDVKYCKSITFESSKKYCYEKRGLPEDKGISEDVLKGESPYEENFDDGVADGWTPVSGIWYVEDGEYVQGNLRGTFLSEIDKFEFTNGIIEVKYKLMERGRNDGISISLRKINRQDTINVSFYRNKNPDFGNSIYVWGAGQKQYPYNLSDDYNTWHTIKLEVKDTELKIYHDGTLAATHQLGRTSLGNVGLISDNTKAHFDYITIKT